MRFSTTAVAAFILYLSAGALSAPVPSSYGMQELVARADGKDTIAAADKALAAAITEAHTRKDLATQNIRPSGKLETVSIDHGNNGGSSGSSSKKNGGGGSGGTGGTKA